MALLERLYEPHLTDRARLRLRADLLALEEALYRQYAHEFFRPHPYRHRVRQEGLEVFADEELGLWQFWSREETCWGQLANGVLVLQDPPSPRLLRAVLRVAFELEGVQVVRVGRQSYGRSSYLEQFAGFGEAAPDQPPSAGTRRSPPRKRRHASQSAPKP